MVSVYEAVVDGQTIAAEDIGMVIKLILRYLIWAELFCSGSAENAVRFGYDDYLYFNSERDMGRLLEKVEKSGLFVK